MTKKWFVSIPVYASANVYVNADTKEDAIKKAYEEMSTSLCHQCTNDFEIGDADTGIEPSAEECE